MLMNNTGKSFAARLLAGAALAAPLACAPAAMAQEAQTNAGASRDVITVTARRREESLQNVPLSVSAFSPDRLERLQADDISLLQNSTPNVTFHEGDAENAVIYIRGIGQIDSLAFAEPGVGVYLDDVYLARTQGAVLDVFDVERVEILRGPQGTLYGRNTIGGAVRFISTRPGDDPGLQLELGAGEHESFSLRARASGQLSDTVAAKAAVFARSHDGYATNVVDGSPDGDLSSLSGRIGLLFEPSDTLELELSVEGSQDSPEASRTPARATAVAGFDPDTGAVRVFDPNTDDPFQVRANFNDLDDLSTFGATLRGQWRANEAWTLTSITAHRSLSYDADLDLDATELEIFDIFVRQDAEQFSQEFRAEYDGGGSLQATAGLYYFHDEDETFNGLAGSAIALPLGGGAFLPFPLQTGSINDQETEAFAIYADGSFALTERLNLSAGLRYTAEEKTLDRVQEAYAPGTANPPAFGTGAVITDIEASEDFSALTPKIGLDFQANDDFMVYALASRGFKSGGFDGRSNTPFDADPYDPEFVWSYEAGVKAALAEGALTLNAAVFRNDYTDLQLSSFAANPDTGAFEAQFTNAGEALIQGAEAEFVWRPASGFTLSGHLGFLDARYEEFIGPGGADISDQREIVNAPEWSGGLAATQVWTVGDRLEAQLHVDAAWRTKTYPTVSSSEVLAQDGYGVVNALAALGAQDERWRISLGVRNLFDERYITQGFDVSAFPGYQLAYYGEPRTAMVRVSLRR